MQGDIGRIEASLLVCQCFRDTTGGLLDDTGGFLTSVIGGASSSTVDVLTEPLTADT